MSATTTTVTEPLCSSTEFGRWRRAERLVAAAIETDLLDTAGLSLTFFDVLDRIADEPLRANELASAIGLSPSGLTRLIDSMVRRGLVERHRDDVDRRGVLIAATTHGRETAAATRPVMAELIDRHFTSHLLPEILRHADGASAVLTHFALNGDT